ncbi:MAG: hypothetical protein HKN23_07865 [Verrucomicrobiales bacterium]|nr:hypothetical protein [Verrucomicrobiales bacterium]
MPAPFSARENPFASERIEQLLKFDPSWLGTEWETILDEFEEEHERRAAVIGAHGSGKTTFLDTFEPLFREKTGLRVCRLFLNDEKPELTRQERVFLTNIPNHESTVIFLDGEERMNFFDRLEFSRLAHGFAGLLVTRHTPRRGIPTLLETKTTPEMLAAFLKKLMPDFPAVESEVADLFVAHDGNLREALREAYDRVGI